MLLLINVELVPIKNQFLKPNLTLDFDLGGFHIRDTGPDPSILDLKVWYV